MAAVAVVVMEAAEEAAAAAVPAAANIALRTTCSAVADTENGSCAQNAGMNAASRPGWERLRREQPWLLFSSTWLSGSDQRTAGGGDGGGGCGGGGLMGGGGGGNGGGGFCQGGLSCKRDIHAVQCTKKFTCRCHPST